MTLVQKDMTYFFSSSEALGAQNKDNNGSRFQINLDRPIAIPNNAVDVSIEVTSANIWFTTPNIDASYKNNKLYVYYSDPINGSTTFTLEIPKGLYSVASLNETIDHLMRTITIPGTAERFECNSIVLSGDTATQKVKIQLGPNLSIFTDPDAYPDNIADPLGFLPTNPIGPSSYTGEIFTAPVVARLNRINSYLLHGDIVKNGIQVNNTQANILTEIQLDVSPGKLLTYRPYLPYKLDGAHLKYGSRDLLTFWLTNEVNEYLDMNEENYSFSLTITYKIDVNHIMTQGRIPNA
jgi:hypothetical protein